MAKRLFISFAIEDAQYRDFLVGQSRLDACPFEFVDMSVKEPWSTDWKIKCRSKIKGCDGMVAILSRNTPNATGARWEIACAREESVPVLGVYVSDTNRPASTPAELVGVRSISWTWDGIKRFIDAL